MKSVNDLSIDRKDLKEIEMRREINPCTYRSAINLDPNASSSSTSMSIITSLGVILHETDAESKCGREQKQALKQNYDATKATNIERLSWLSTSHSSTEQSVKHSRGLKYNDVNTNSSDYVFTKDKNSYEAYPVQNWYTFTQTNVHKTVDFDEAEKQNQERCKHLDKWFPKQQAMKEKNTEDDIQNNNEKDTKSTNKNKRDLQLLDAEEWIHENDENEYDVDKRSQDNDNNNPNKKSKTNKKDKKKSKYIRMLCDSDEDESIKKQVNKTSTMIRQTEEDEKKIQMMLIMN
ncbi:unnamed protein product, partial [Rotaria sp. Silwood2]